jgi:hypothetical protein
MVSDLPLLTFAQQASSAPNSSGRHDCSMKIVLNYGTAVTVTASGWTFVPVNGSSMYGNGCSFASSPGAGGVDTEYSRLYSLSASGSDPAGVVRVFGNGGSALVGGFFRSP